MRKRHRLRVLSVCIAFLPAAAVPALGQKPSRDCAPRMERARDDPHGPVWRAMLLAFIAPSAVVLLAEPPCGEDKDETERPAVGNYVAVFGAGGLAANGYWRGGVTQSGAVELLVRGVYAEARMHRYANFDGVRMWEARAGYFAEPARGIAGGVTAGYRQVRGAPDGWTRSGVLIGFPLVINGCAVRSPCRLQVEQAYLINEREFTGNPRARLDVGIPRTPLVAQVEFESRGVRKADPMSLTLGFGVRR